MPEIPAYSRSARKRQDRPVTPEVAGSSPVAPVFEVPANSYVVLAEQTWPCPPWPNCLSGPCALAGDRLVELGETVDVRLYRELEAGRCDAAAELDHVDRR